MTQTKHDEIVNQLDLFYTQAKRQILQNQSAITGLFPSNSAEKSNASIKTSLWAASSIHSLYLAYSRRVDHDQGKAHDLGQSVVKCMRGILFAWMRQSEKVESFKANQCPKHALHLKFDLHSGLANDFEYPHLQIDVVSLYLIFLSNFIASGLDIIYCMDEVTFIQNLVYYVERAYRTPDYGNWEPSQNQSQRNSIGPMSQPYSFQHQHQHQQQQQQQQQSQQQQKQQQTVGTSYNPYNPTTTNRQPTLSHFPAPASTAEFYPPKAHASSSSSSSSSAASTSTFAHNQQSGQPSTSRHSAATLNQNSNTGVAFNYEPINYHQPNSCVHCSNEGQQLEIHATSIGMAKSALEAINGCNLFGGKGANWSIIYSDIDAHSRNRSIFETLLPRESRSKNTDSYLLATISWPCFATSDPSLYTSTKAKVLRKLKGKYGLRRFLRDPYGTILQPSGSTDREGSKRSSGDNQTTQDNQSILNENNSLDGSFQREISFCSTTSGASCASPTLGGEQPKVKLRKSSYHQRKNYFRNQNYQANLSSSGSGGGSGGQFVGQDQTAPSVPSNQPNSSISMQRTESSSKMSKRFEHIEAEWPLFVCFLIIDGIFKQDLEQVYENEKLLYERLLKSDPKTGDYLMPKYYYVPPELIYNEKCHPDSVERIASEEGSSDDQLFITGQSILLIARLLLAGLLHPNELDPLRRHMPSHDRPKRIGRYSSFQATSPDLVVQTVLIAESIRLQAMMANYGIQTQTPREVEPVQIWSSSQLVKVYEYLGVNQKLGLKGRPARPIGALGTTQDMLLLIDDIQNELNFIGRYWRMSGRPTVCIIIREEHLRDVHFRDLLDLLVQFKNGQLKKSGLRIKTGRLQNLISSSCIEHLDFLHLLPHEHLPQFKSFRQLVESPKQSLLLNSTSRTTSYSTQKSRYRHHLAKSANSASNNSDHLSTKSRRILCSSSSNNLQAIEEQANMSCDEDIDVDDDEDDENNMQAYENQRGYDDDGPQFDVEEESLQKFAEKLDFNMSDASMYKFNSLDLEQNYSTEASSSIDYYECYKEAPLWPTLIDLLKTCTDLSGQSQLLAILWDREGPKYIVDDMSVEDRLEQVSQLACQSRNWSVVRYCSSVLRRSVESLSPWLTSILVNGKQISLGTGPTEKIINNPLTPTEIHTLLYSTMSTKSPCDAVLQQEIALYIGRLISTRPDYFDGILTIRVPNFMSAMRSYLSIKNNEKKLKLQQQQEEALAKFEAAQQRHLLRQQRQRRQQHQQRQSFEPSEELLDLRMKQEAPTSDSGQHTQEEEEEGDGGTSQAPQIVVTNADKAATNQEPSEDIETRQNEPDIMAPPGIKIEVGGSATQHPRSLLYQQSHANAQSSTSKISTRYGKRAAQNLVARPLESLSPSDVRKLLVKVLSVDETLAISDRRQITGELCRVPKQFYDRVWSLLHCTNVGIVIGGRILRSAPILTNMTQDDLNFALKVESILNSIDDPKLRQINVELLMALHVLFERNPEIRFDTEPLDLNKIIQLSLIKFGKDHGCDDYGLDEFYTNTTEMVGLYTVRTVFDCLMPAKYRDRDRDRDRAAVNLTTDSNNGSRAVS